MTDDTIFGKMRLQTNAPLSKQENKQARTEAQSVFCTLPSKQLKHCNSISENETVTAYWTLNRF